MSALFPVFAGSLSPSPSAARHLPARWPLAKSPTNPYHPSCEPFAPPQAWFGHFALSDVLLARFTLLQNYKDLTPSGISQDTQCDRVIPIHCDSCADICSLIYSTTPPSSQQAAGYWTLKENKVCFCRFQLLSTKDFAAASWLSCVSIGCAYG